jgi:PmbA protein
MKDILDRVRKEVDQAEVYHHRTRGVPIVFHSGALESIKIHEAEGLALRVVKGGRLGFSTTTDLADPRGMIASAVAAAAFGDEAGFHFPSDGARQAPAVRDEAVLKLKDEDLIERAEKAVRRLQEAAPEAEVNVTLGKGTETVEIANSSGLTAFEERTIIGVGIEAALAREGDIYLLAGEAQGRFVSDIDLERIVDRLVYYLSLADRIASVPSKPLPVVFTPRGAIALLMPLLAGFNGKSVLLGTSPLKGRVGEQVVDRRVTLVDDGTVVRGPRSAGFDDEGTPTARTALLEGGVVKGFIYDLRTAARAKAHPTGNGYKTSAFGGGGFRSLPGVSTSNTVLSPGTETEETLVAGIQEGLLVEAVLGLGQGNIQAGEFSNNVAIGFKIEKGKVVGRVKNTMIAGNVYDLLKDHLVALASEPEWTSGSIQTPAIVVDGVSVTSDG